MRPSLRHPFRALGHAQERAHARRATIIARVERPVRARPRLRRVHDLLRDLVHEWHDDRMSGLAAEVAFFWLLSLFPTLLAMTAALGWLELLVGSDVTGRVEEAIVDFLNRVLTDEAGGTIDAVQQLFAESDAGVALLGAVTALWAASRGFAAVINALRVVYDEEERRSYPRRRGVALCLALGTVVVAVTMLAVLVLGPLLGTGDDVAETFGWGGAFGAVWDWIRWPVSMIALVSWAATVLHVAPSHRTPWRWDLPGALFAGVSWALLSVGLRVYLTLAPQGNQVFGTLGGTLIVLLWLYLLGVGLLLGGQLNALLVARAGVEPEGRVTRHPPPSGEASATDTDPGDLDVVHHSRPGH